MGRRHGDSGAELNARLRELSAAGHGVFSGEELERAGLPRGSVLWRRKTGLLVPVLRDIYALPGTRLDARGRARAAMLSGGEGCVVSHASALALHGLVAGHLPVHVTKTGGADRHCGGPFKVSQEFGFRVWSHQSRSLRESQITVQDGIRLTTVERALLEFSADSTPEQVGKALSQGERERKICWRTLAQVVGQANGHRGVGRLRSEIDFFDPVFLDGESDPEEDFLRMLRRRNRPRPEVNVWMEPYRVDFFWRHLLLAVELDPFSTHSGAASFRRDHRKSVDLEARGLRVIRFTGYDLYQDEDRTNWQLGQIMEQQASLLGVEIHIPGITDWA